MQDILTYGDDRLLKELKRAEKPAYVCTIASSDTGAIEGISIAGASAEMRRYTPPADMEALFYGEAKCIPGVAATPDGIPARSRFPHLRGGRGVRGLAPDPLLPSGFHAGALPGHRQRCGGCGGSL